MSFGTLLFHKEQKLHECNTCKFKFKHIYELNRHVSEVHEKVNLFKPRASRKESSEIFLIAKQFQFLEGEIVLLTGQLNYQKTQK